MSLRPKRNKKKRVAPPSGESESKRLVRLLQTHNPVKTRTPPKKVSREKITKAIKKANKGARQFSHFN